MTHYSFVLSDDLYYEYHKYKHASDFGGDFDKGLINKLLPFRLSEFRTNKAQLLRAGIEFSSLSVSLQKALGSNLSNLSIEELAKKTDYKLIITRENGKTSFPYINIGKNYMDPIVMSVTGKFTRGTRRIKALKHIQSLCQGAQKIYLYDKYLLNNEHFHILKDILPNRADLSVYYVANQRINGRESGNQAQLDTSAIVYLKENGLGLVHFKEISQEEIPQYAAGNLHDRYLRIDDKFEILLSSGFYYLGNNNKDITYVVRPI